ncbi:hypothetical protein Tco_1408781 [Tanacetum coccineum]
MSRAAYNSIIKRELVYTGNNIVGKAKNLQVFIRCHSFLTDFIILENVNEFVEKGLAEVIFGKPFKEKIGLKEDISKGIIWFKIGDDKIIFNMPRAEKRLSKLTTEQQNLMSPILKISDEDKANGISHPYQKIKEFYKDCLNLGEEYKQNLEVLEVSSTRFHVVARKRISEKRTKNEAKTNKTEHGMEESEKTKLNQSQSPRKSKSKSIVGFGCFDVSGIVALVVQGKN